MPQRCKPCREPPPHTHTPNHHLQTRMCPPGTRAPGAGGWPPRPHSPRPPHEDGASGRRARLGASTALRRACQAVLAQGRNRPKRGTCTPTRLCARCSDAPIRCWFSAGTLSPGTAHGGRPSLADSALKFRTCKLQVRTPTRLPAGRAALDPLGWRAGSTTAAGHAQGGRVGDLKSVRVASS